MKIEDYLAKRAMGGKNSVYKLQNYVVGLSPNGLILDNNGELDFEKSFRRINYFEFLHSQKVNNNVQKALSNRPIDFVTATIPLKTIARFLSEDLQPNVEPIYIYGGADKQALILTRKDANGKIRLRFLPIANLTQKADGDFSFKSRNGVKVFRSNFLKMQI